MKQYKKPKSTLKTSAFIIKITVLCLLILTVLFFLTPLGGLISIWAEGPLTKWEINNPYVDSRYHDWKDVCIPSFQSFKIPKDWGFQEHAKGNDVYSISNEAGEVWAYVTTYISDIDSLPNYSEFIDTIFHGQYSEISFDSFDEFVLMRGSDIDEIILHGTENKTYYCIQLLDDSYHEIFFVLLVDLRSDPTQFDIAEAIVYSFVY